MFDSQELAAFIENLTAAVPTNRLGCPGSEGQPVWDRPLIGYAAGDDPLFAFFKQDIGDFYWLPAEAFAIKYPAISPGHLSVLSLAFPHTEGTRREQRANDLEPGPRWRYSRKHWPEFMAEVAAGITACLATQDIRAVTPELLPEWHWQQSARYGYASNWSQRHTAYAAGLGTFGLSDGLITSAGKAVRFLSLVIEADIPATPRTYQTHQEWCPFLQDGSCGVCISRCPAGAITAAGHDKPACAAYGAAISRKYLTEGEGTAGCGLCQTGVPCEFQRPDRAGRIV